MRIQMYTLSVRLEDGQSADGLGDRIFETLQADPAIPPLSLTNAGVVPTRS